MFVNLKKLKDIICRYSSLFMSAIFNHPYPDEESIWRVHTLPIPLGIFTTCLKPKFFQLQDCIGPLKK